MSIWLHYTEDEKFVMLQQTAKAINVVEQAVEKDWWVSAILMALSRTSCAEYLQFKGGTSLSKAWGLINRFSEDIDLAISRSFFGLPENTVQQRTAIRRKSFHFIKDILIEELIKILISYGISDFEIKLVTSNSSAMVVIVEVKYNSLFKTMIDYVSPIIKIEFSAMSLDGLNPEREITTLVHSRYPEIDDEIRCKFKSVLPERTFLEKIFLLHEEYQKEKPRTQRMSRHIYDLEKLMDSPLTESVWRNADLYKTIINHRRKFNNIQGIDYRNHFPAQIQICPPEKLQKSWEEDYNRLQESYIYDKSKNSFEELTTRMLELTERIKKMNLQPW